MVAELMSVVAVVGGGVVAGVFVAVAVSVFPTLSLLPAGQYIQLHREMGHRYHPSMPLIVNAAMVADIVLAVIVPGGTAKVLFGFAATALLGTQFVSHLCNVPINKSLRGLDPESLPDDWRDPRPLWRSWHRLRTSLALVALAVTAAAVALT